MKYRKFNVTFYVGFKKVGSSQMVSGSEEGLTLEEAKQYCKEKFPGKRCKVEL